MKLWMKIFIGLFVGVALGLVLEDKAIFFKPIGDIFLNLLSMVVYPLVFCSMVLGIASISDLKKTRSYWIEKCRSIFRNDSNCHCDWAWFC